MAYQTPLTWVEAEALDHFVRSRGQSRNGFKARAYADKVGLHHGTVDIHGDEDTVIASYDWADPGGRGSGFQFKPR